MTTETTTPEILKHLERNAISAHSFTSFSPEIRGRQMIKDYSAELTEDMDNLRSKGIDEGSITDYRTRYERFFTSYLSAKSRTFSAMITGPANFPVRRHEKANRSEEKHYEIFRVWRDKAIKAIIRKSQPEKTYSSELERYRAELAGMQANHEKMKEGNKRIKEALKTGVNIDEYLTATFGIQPHMIDWVMKWGFGLQNNNANMKRVAERIKELEQKEQNRQDVPETEYLFEGGKIVMNYEADRIQIFFDQRLSKDDLSAWKQKGLNSFNWSPSNVCWQRKITANAIWTTKRMFNILK